MKINLHKNARTTPAQRAFIQSNAQMNVSDLAMKIGVSETTIRRWKRRNFVFDKSHTPKHIKTSMAPVDELTAILLRACLRLSLDDLKQVLHRFVFAGCSRSGLNRCLKRYGLSRLPSLQKSLPFKLKDYRGSYFFYTKVDLPGFKTSRGAFSVQTLMDCQFRYVFSEISRFHEGPDMLFINRVVEHYPLSVLGIISSDPVDLFNGVTMPVGMADRQNQLIESYCKHHQLAFQSVETITDPTAEKLRETWAAFGEKKHAFFMKQLDDENHQINRNIRVYNTRLPFRTLRGQTAGQAVEAHFREFPGSFRYNPKIII